MCKYFRFFGIGDEDDKIFLGDAISNIKDNPTEAYAAEVYAIEGAKLNRVYEKIRSGLPFGIISAFRPFKGVFTKDFTDEEQKALIKAAKSDSLTKDFLKENEMAFIENSVIVKHSIKLLWINSQQIRAKRQ